jgi:predicted metal-dependent peptidase
MNPSDILLDELRQICWHQDPTEKVAELDHDILLARVKRLVPTPGIKTMGVGRPQGQTQLAYDPAFVQEYAGRLGPILRHEAEHLLTGDDRAIEDWHTGKLPDPTGRDLTGPQLARLFNIARDCQINDKLEDYGVKLPIEGCSGRRQLGVDVQGWPVEDVMKKVAEDNDWESMKPMEELLQAMASAGQLQPGEGDGDGQGITLKVDLSQGGKDAAQGKEAGKGQGHQAQLQPTPATTRWENLLKEFLDTRKVVESWVRRPKRTLSREDVLTPSRRPQPRRRGLIAIDVSGSVRMDLVQRTMGLVKASPANYELDVVVFNEDVHRWENFRHTNIPVVGGGTDFSSVEAYCRAQRRYPDVVVMLTDGEAAPFECEHKDRWVFMLYGWNAQGAKDWHGMKALSFEEKVL